MANSTPPPRVNFETVMNSWTPEEIRKSRYEDFAVDDKIKVRSLNELKRDLRGGDWIYTFETCMTLAVTWWRNGKKYGLTVAHAFTNYHRGKGASVFAFNSDEKVSKPKLGGGNVFSHKIIKVGTVVSIDEATDSAIIEIYPHIKIDPLVVALSGDDEQLITIELPIPGSTRRIANFGEKLMMFGAAGRGMVGVRVDVPPGTTDNEMTANFATKSLNKNAHVDGASKLTFFGDCGALYLDKRGVACCMHTMIHGTPKESPTTWTSCGTLLEDIVEAHKFYFGHIPIDDESPTLSSSLSFSREQQSPPVLISLTNVTGAKECYFPRPHFAESEGYYGPPEYQPGKSIDSLRSTGIFPAWFLAGHEQDPEEEGEEGEEKKQEE